MSAVVRPVPQSVDPRYRRHYEGLARGEFVVDRCQACHGIQWPPRDVCGRCRAEAFEDAPLSLRGRVHLHTTVHRAFHPWFADQIPYRLVVAESVSGVRVLGLLEGPAEGLVTGAAVVGRVDTVGGVPGLLWSLTEGTSDD